MPKKYNLQLNFEFDAMDDPAARKKAKEILDDIRMEFDWKMNVKLREIFDNDTPRKIDI